MTARALLLLAGFVLAAGPAQAALTAQALAGVGALVRAGDRIPLPLRFTDDHGAARSLRAAIGGRPTLLAIADYRCRYLCGPGLTLTAAARDAAGLEAGRDYSFVVVGLDPRDGPAEASAFRARRLRDRAGQAAVLLTGGRPDQVARALGFRYVYDAQLGQYAHDTSVYALSSDGVARAVLPEFALSGPRLRAALDDARRGWTGQLAEQVRLICYCLQPLTGAYDGTAIAALRVGGVAVLAALGAGLLMLARRRERRG